MALRRAGRVSDRRDQRRRASHQRGLRAGVGVHDRREARRSETLRSRRRPGGPGAEGRPHVRPIPVQARLRRRDPSVGGRARCRAPPARISRLSGRRARVHDRFATCRPRAPMKLGPLFEGCGIAVPRGAEDLDVRAIVYDSRKAAPGSLFVAIGGFHRDGHDFADDAVTRAVLADLAAEFFDHPTRKLKLAGVTGTDGKTTTVHLVSDVLQAAGERTGYATTVDFKVTEHEWANDTRQSTQEAVEVQEFFAELLVAGGTWGVLEATSHALALRKLRGCEIDVAVFTNLSPEHLDFHGTLQEYLDAKAILFDMLRAGTDKGVPKTAVLNADDPHWRYLADRAIGASVLTYGMDAHADVQGTVLAADASGSRVKIEAHGETAEIGLPLVGRFNVHNALAAAATGIAAGVPLAKVRDALQRAR